jgi:hypothetical protein
VHAKARRMRGSGAGGGRREEPWRVVALVRRCLVALVRRSRAEEVQHGGGAQRRRPWLRQNLQSRIEPAASKHLAAHSPLAPPFSASVHE